MRISSLKARWLVSGDSCSLRHYAVVLFDVEPGVGEEATRLWSGRFERGCLLASWSAGSLSMQGYCVGVRTNMMSIDDTAVNLQ